MSSPPTTSNKNNITTPPLLEHRIRLHISPFTPALTNKILGSALEGQASNISFHTLQTFPERSYGYVELPAMEAQKLKKKLNGSTLKGTKVKIEDAKPERRTKRRPDNEGEDVDVDRKARKLERKERKRTKRGESGLPNEISGHELEGSRHVKRGWSDGASAPRGTSSPEKSTKSKFEGSDAVEGKRLRFKTTLTPTTDPGEEKNTKSKSKEEKKEGKERKSRKTKVVVEEFGKTKKLPRTPIKSDAAGHNALEYEDGKGWIDESGNVIEPERASSGKQYGDADQEVPERRISAIESRETADLEISQDLLSKVENDEDDTMSVDDNTAEQPITTATSESQPDEEKEVHPLEALFKRPTTRASASKPRPKPINTSFSFFDTNEAGTEDQEMDGTGMAPPQTPHTKRDMEWRSIRSAAPTPDTAAIGRHFSFPGFGGSDDDEEVEDQILDREVDDAEQVGMHGVDSAAVPIGGPVGGDGNEAGGEESAFRKWFYENRGDFNRGWKKRRREGRKVERQRENRRVSRRVV